MAGAPEVWVASTKPRPPVTSQTVRCAHRLTHGILLLHELAADDSQDQEDCGTKKPGKNRDDAYLLDGEVRGFFQVLRQPCCQEAHGPEVGEHAESGDEKGSAKKRLEYWNVRLLIEPGVCAAFGCSGPFCVVIFGSGSGPGIRGERSVFTQDEPGDQPQQAENPQNAKSPAPSPGCDYESQKWGSDYRTES